MKPILSICITTKNRANYLEETLLSILIQKPSSVEIVILDSSLDNQTRSLIEKLNLLNPIFKYIKNEKLLFIQIIIGANLRYLDSAAISSF